VAVVGITLMFPLVEPAGAPLIETLLAFVLFQLKGATASAGFVGVVLNASIVSTSLAPPHPFALR
jgi:hypothetical protein